MKKELIQVEGEPDSCNGCEFLLETNDTCLCRRCLVKGRTCESTLIYKLLEPKLAVSRKKSNKSKKGDNGKS